MSLICGGCKGLGVVLDHGERSPLETLDVGSHITLINRVIIP
jgi:hypothetical protein